MKFSCLYCGTENAVKKNTTNKYCTNKCQRAHEHERLVAGWLEGTVVGYTGRAAQVKNFVRKWMFDTKGAKCERCGWDKLHPVDGKPLVEIDHIDGNATNCAPDNLRILCPNCHSMTPTFRTRNKASARNRK